MFVFHSCVAVTTDYRVHASNQRLHHRAPRHQVSKFAPLDRTQIKY